MCSWLGNTWGIAVITEQVSINPPILNHYRWPFWLSFCPQWLPNAGLAQTIKVMRELVIKHGPESSRPVILLAVSLTCWVTDSTSAPLSWLYSIYLKLFLFWAWCFAYRQANKGQTLNRRLFQWPADKHLCREIHPSSEGPLRQVALLAILNCLCWSWIESR